MEDPNAEKELALGECSELLKKQFDAFAKTKLLMEKKFGKTDARPARCKEGSVPAEKKDIPTLVVKAIEKFNVDNGGYFSREEHAGLSEGGEADVLRGKEFSVKLKGVPAMWTPDMDLPFKLNIKFQVYILELWKKDGQSNVLLTIRELEAFKKALAKFLESELHALEGQIEIEMPHNYY